MDMTHKWFSLDTIMNRYRKLMSEENPSENSRYHEIVRMMRQAIVDVRLFGLPLYTRWQINGKIMFVHLK